MAKIYTKTGDRGQTSLVGGQRVSKCCDRLESYGTIDELNSFVGLLLTSCVDSRDRAFLTKVQSILFIVGAYLATDHSKHDDRGNVVTDLMIQQVEAEIDYIDSLVPSLRVFILPGGSQAAAYAHVCRTVCRRAERSIYRLVECGVEVDDHLTSYINRLSDYFFILARKLNLDAGNSDVEWKKEE